MVTNRTLRNPKYRCDPLYFVGWFVAGREEFRWKNICTLLSGEKEEKNTPGDPDAIVQHELASLSTRTNFVFISGIKKIPRYLLLNLAIYNNTRFLTVCPSNPRCSRGRINSIDKNKRIGTLRFGTHTIDLLKSDR